MAHSGSNRWPGRCLAGNDLQVPKKRNEEKLGLVISKLIVCNVTFPFEQSDAHVSVMA